MILAACGGGMRDLRFFEECGRFWLVFVAGALDCDDFLGLPDMI